TTTGAASGPIDAGRVGEPDSMPREEQAQRQHSAARIRYVSARRASGWLLPVATRAHVGAIQILLASRRTTRWAQPLRYVLHSRRCDAMRCCKRNMFNRMPDKDDHEIVPGACLLSILAR